MSTERQPLTLNLLTQAGRLLLEYNESAGEIHRALEATARIVSDEPLSITLSYGGIAVSLGREGPMVAPVRELRLNATIQSRVHGTLQKVARGELVVGEAICELDRAEVDTSRHPRWLVAILICGAAASLTRLLGADGGAAIAAASGAGFGLLARQELGRRHFSTLALPFVAGFIGAVISGFAIRSGWTITPGLALIVPALVLVPGPHIINGLLDLVDNYIPMAVARLTLAGSILIVTALGIIIGIELTLGQIPVGETRLGGELNVFSDMLFAGIATCGFAVAYNTSWRHVAMAAVGGMFGHGLRFLALEGGWSLEAATFVGGLSVGVVSACIAKSTKTPVAVIAFAGAVTMMPGLQMYRALGGALRIAHLPDIVDPSAMAATLGFALQASLVAGALALGLVVGLRVIARIASGWGPSAADPARSSVPRP